MGRRKAVVFGAALVLCSCVSRRAHLPPLIPPSREARLEELVESLNARQQVNTFIARAQLQFVTRERPEEGLGRRYHSGRGRLLLARPESIRLSIEAPVLSANIADMASNGRRFQLLIYPPEYRALIEGSNRGDYSVEAQKLAADPKLRKAGPLVNIRPQHFTEAFLFEPVEIDEAFYDEARPLEDDDRPRAKKGQKIIRSYYVVSVIPRGARSPRWKYWFDRTRDLMLARQQSFNAKGLLVGDVHFRKVLPPDPATGLRFASEVYIERPYESYALRISLEPASIQVNREIPSRAFRLEPPPEWGTSLLRVELDPKRGSPPPRDGSATAGKTGR